MSLKYSHVNPVRESQIKEIIKEQYPSFYLGDTKSWMGAAWLGLRA